MSKSTRLHVFFPTTLTFFIILATRQAPVTEGANILFFFIGGSYSHKTGIWPLVTELAQHGHNVTVLSSYSQKPSENALVTDLVPKALGQCVSETYQVDRLAMRREGRALDFWNDATDIIIKVCELLLLNTENDPQLHHLVHQAQFDLIVNNAVLGDCGLILNARVKAKLILSVSSFLMPWYGDLFGFPQETSWVPEVTGKFSYPMSFLDRLYNMVLPLHWTYERETFWYPNLDEVVKKIYKLTSYPSTREIEKSASLLLVNNHFATTELARSLPPFVIDIGGMHCWLPQKPLSKEFQDYLDGAKDGAILIAFGSTIDLKNMPDYFKSIFFGVMAKFPHIRFIWRWEGDLPPNTPKNLMASKWLPQIEILAHPNLKIFISHAGLNSLTEATYHGKPVILLPLFADQDYNGYNVEVKKVGLRLEIETLTPQIMENAIQEILSNDKYAKNMAKLSSIFRDRPMDPIKKALFWTEFVLRHDDVSSLKPLTYLNMFQQRMLDIFLLLWLITVVSICFCFTLIVKIFQKFFTKLKLVSAQSLSSVQEKKSK